MAAAHEKEGTTELQIRLFAVKKEEEPFLCGSSSFCLLL
jgi:hypothetical protein